MYIPFSEITDSSRVWIYQSNRAFTKQELVLVNQKLLEFTNTWSAHQVPLHSSFSIVESLFIIIVVNEAISKVSGCSIDSSVAIIKKKKKELNVDLFDRTKIIVDIEGRVEVLSIKDFKSILRPDLLVFNNLIISKGDLEFKFKIPVSQSWHSKYLK